jgi:hypothetical protein
LWMAISASPGPSLGRRIVEVKVATSTATALAGTSSVTRGADVTAA